MTAPGGRVDSMCRTRMVRLANPIFLDVEIAHLSCNWSLWVNAVMIYLPCLFIFSLFFFASHITTFLYPCGIMERRRSGFTKFKIDPKSKNIRARHFENSMAPSFYQPNDHHLGRNHEDQPSQPCPWERPKLALIRHREHGQLPKF